MVYLWSSKLSTLVLGNFGLWVLAVVTWSLRKVFLGELRAPELELLSDNVRPTVMSLLFFLTIFRTQFNAAFLSGLVLLMCSKAAHWVAEARVNAMEQSPSDSSLTHARVASLLLLLLVVDTSIVYWAAARTLATGPSLLLLFGFEYCILALSATSLLVLFALNLVAVRREQAWHAKGTYVLYLEFAGSTLQSLVYLAFFFIIFRYYGLPLHIIRPMYISFAAFQRSLAKLLTYRRAVSGMDHRYPDATAADLTAVDSICIVCRDEMTAGKKLPCGHILHLECLRAWLQQDPTCPLCRKSVLIEELYRSDEQLYAAEFNRFLNVQAGRGRDVHRHQHAQPGAAAQVAPAAAAAAAMEQPHEAVAATSAAAAVPGSVSDDDGSLRTEIEAMRSQLDFLQSLVVSQMDLLQQIQSNQVAAVRSTGAVAASPQGRAPPEGEEDVRGRRLNFFKN